MSKIYNIEARLTEEEYAQLVAAIEVAHGISDDLLTEELYVPQGKDYVTLNREEMAELREDLNRRLNELLALKSLARKLEVYGQRFEI